MGQLINLSVSDDTTRPFGGVNQNPNQEQYPCPCQTAKSYLSLKSQTVVTSQSVLYNYDETD